MRIVGVIPSRYASTRFPAKPLALLQGKPMIQWVVQAAQKSRRLQEVLVATDHVEIANAAKAVGAKVVMTASDLPTGSDRIFAAVKDLAVDVIVNIQGDEPLISPALIDEIAGLWDQDSTLDMATAAHPISLEELASPNAVKVVVNQFDEALYFSRFPIPYSRQTAQAPISGCLKHVGMYAYRKSFLQKFCETAPTELEKAESLEQLRALHLGAKLKVLRVKEASPGVDTPEDLLKVEKILRGK